MAAYRVEHTQPSIVLDAGGRPVNGFSVRILMIEYNEIRELELVDDSPKSIHEAAMSAIERRMELDSLAEDS